MTMRLFFIVACLIFSGVGLAQQVAPETPATRVLSAWLAAFNSADTVQVKAFDDIYKPTPPMAQLARFRKQTGGFTLVRVEKGDATSITGLLKENGSDNIARFELTVSADEPPKMTGANIKLIPTPPDLAPPRLSQSEALVALTRHLDVAASQDKFSGAVLIAKSGRVLYEKAWGRSDRETSVPVSLDTQFRLGSMNKMFTAIATLQLIDAGKLSFDDTLGKHLSDYPNKDIANKVTIRHLLTHTGGTGDIFGPEYDQNRLLLKSHADYVSLYGNRSPVHEPGATWRYSNYGFVLLGALIEKLSGMSYYEYVQKKVFAPALMNATASLPETEPVPMRAVGYMEEEGKWIPNTDTLPWRGTAAGGGYSTVGDLLRFADALQSDKLVSKALLAQATRAQAQAYGYGFSTAGEGKWAGYGHSGGAPGMSGELRVIPKQGYVFIVLSNLDPPAATRVVRFVEARLPEEP